MTRSSLRVVLWMVATMMALGLIIILTLAPVRWVFTETVDHLRFVGPANFRVCLCTPDEISSVTTSRNLTLPVSIYRSEQPKTRGVVILVHGNTPLGRKHPFYRIIGSELSERGFEVVAPDLAGFGDSENPFESLDRPGYDFADDLTAVVGDRTSDGATGSGVSIPLFLVGHSMGAVPAMRVGLTESSVEGIVAIGPPRRIQERISSTEDRSYFWNRAKRTHMEVYGSRYPSWFTREEWVPVKMREALEGFLPTLQSEGHTPVLFIDGGLEPPEDLEYLERFVWKLEPPVSHERVVGSDHYANVRGAGPLVLYDVAAVGETATLIEEWLDPSPDSGH